MDTIHFTGYTERDGAAQTFRAEFAYNDGGQQTTVLEFPSSPVVHIHVCALLDRATQQEGFWHSPDFADVIAEVRDELSGDIINTACGFASYAGSRLEKPTAEGIRSCHREYCRMLHDRV